MTDFYFVIKQKKSKKTTSMDFDLYVNEE